VIKILHRERAGDPAAAHRFLQEARTATQIKHSNVAILYDYSQLPDGSFYMVWEHIEGEDVGQRLRRDGPLPVAVAVDLAIQALRGLGAIHAAGVIHRDVSPDNLMIRGDGRGRYQLKIIDLGLAKDLAAAANFEITQAGMFVGKLRYCSPEQARASEGVTIDHRSDLYSLGVVLYEMICGLPPYDSESQHGFVLKRLSEDPLPLRTRNPAVRVPRELDQVVERALARDREDRFPDAVAFIHALARVGDTLRDAATREVQAAPRLPPPSPGRTAPVRGPAKELSREERLDLLAQIDRAAKKVGDRQRLEEETSGREAQIAEAETLLQGYLAQGKHALAVFAFETLLELQPGHPRRADYQNRLAQLGDLTGRRKRAGEAVAAGREALLRGDMPLARVKLETAEAEDFAGDATAGLRHELAATEASEARQGERESYRRRFEELLEAGRVDEAERMLHSLPPVEANKVTLDGYRTQLAEARVRFRDADILERHERRYRERLQARDWSGARDAVRELGQALPSSSRPGEMFEELSRLEQGVRRREAVEQGLRTVESFIAQSKPLEAETALKVLTQLDPQNPNLRRLERQVQALWQS
jgi:hypothetical protein